MENKTKEYYLHKERDQSWTIRQTRFQHSAPQHPHDICAVNSNLEGIKEMGELSIFKGKIETYEN